MAPGDLSALPIDGGAAGAISALHVDGGATAGPAYGARALPLLVKGGISALAAPRTPRATTDDLSLYICTYIYVYFLLAGRAADVEHKKGRNKTIKTCDQDSR